MLNALILIPEITKGMKSTGSKSLLKIRNSKCIIEYQIEQLLSISKNIKITIGTGFDNDRITSAINRYSKVDYIFNPKYEHTNFGESLKLYFDKYKDIDNLLLIGSGILFRSGTFAPAQLKNTSKIFLLDKPKHNFDLGCNTGNNLEYLFYELPDIWSECIYLNKKAIKCLYDISQSKSIEQMYIFELINDMLSYNIKIEKVSLSKSNFVKINTAKDIGRARVFV